jgi:hypothetical protein
MSLLLLILYPVVIQYERKGWWYLLAPLAIIAYVVDVIANYTELSLIYGWPRKGEFTLSNRLWRLSNIPGWRGDLASWIMRYTDWFDPDGYHIDKPKLNITKVR